MKKIIILVIIIIAAVSSFLLFKKDDSIVETTETKTGAKIGTSIGDIAPDFTLEDIEGNMVSLSDFRDSIPVFINFWAEWCPFCVDELPLMDETQNKYGGRYVTLAVNRGESSNSQKEFLDELGISGSMIFLLNEKDDIYRRYGGFAMPYSLYLDKDGVIVDIKHGPLTREELENKINKIICKNISRC